MMDIIDKINKPNAAPGDYIGPDGLLYCGKCHTPKQMRGSGVLAGKLLSITCACKEDEAQAAELEAKRKRIEDLRARCLPVEAMHKRVFATAGDEKHIEAARRYVERWEQMRAKNIGLMFWGNTGTGKTYAAQCIANALIDREIPVMYTTAVDLVAKLMNRETRREEFMEQLRKVPLLIIDDVGAERDTAFSREQICAVIDARSESGKPLVVTTNYTVGEMKKREDSVLERFFNRLLGCCAPVAVIGDSKRNAIAAQKMQLARELLEL